MAKSKIVQGKKIKSVQSIGSFYDNGCVNVYTNTGKQFKLHVDEILKMVKDYQFSVNKKKVHSYLIDPEPVE